MLMQLEFELASYTIAAQYISLYNATTTHSRLLALDKNTAADEVSLLVYSLKFFLHQP